MNNKSKIRAVARSIGTKSTIAIIIVFLLTIAATCVGGYWLYRAIKQDMQLQGKVNAVQAAKEYLLRLGCVEVSELAGMLFFMSDI